VLGTLFGATSWARSSAGAKWSASPGIGASPCRAHRSVHLADSQRREPGSGHLDFGSVFEALADNAYSGALAMEFLPASDVAIRAGREWVEARI
jgi:hypothetical protein